MANPNIRREYDERLNHRAVAAAAITATAVISTIEQRVAQRTAYATLVNVEALDIASNDELYQFVIEVSNDDFTTIEVAAMHDVGATEVRQSGAPDSAAGDSFELEWTTEVGEEVYKDWRLNLVVAGTSPSITFNSHTSKR